MEEFKIGDRIQFKTWDEMKQKYGLNEYGNIKSLSSPISFSAAMRHLCNTYATIQSISGVDVELTDFTDRGDTTWNYTIQMLKLAKLTNDINFNERVVILKQGGKTYKAICSPDDKFDLEKGIMVCLLKSKGIKYPEIEELTKNAKTIDFQINEIKPKFSNGDMVYSKDFGRGEILAILRDIVNYKYIYSVKWFVTDDSFYVPENELTLDGIYEYGLKFKRTPNPKQQMQVKGVYRMAKVGEYIKLITPHWGFDKVGDILRVDTIDGEYNNMVGVLGKHHKRKTPDATGNWCYLTEDYVVLENYVPPKQPRDSRGRFIRK